MKKRYALLSLGFASALVLAACSDEKTEEKKEKVEEIEKIEVESTEPTPKVEEKTEPKETVEPEAVTKTAPAESHQSVQQTQPVQKEKAPVVQPVAFDFSSFKTRLVEKDNYLANAKADGIDAAGNQMEMNNYAAKDKELSEGIYLDIVAYILSNLNDSARIQELTVDLEVFEHNLNMEADAAYKAYEGGSIAPLVYDATLSEGYQAKINHLIAQFQ